MCKEIDKKIIRGIRDDGVRDIKKKKAGAGNTGMLYMSIRW